MNSCFASLPGLVPEIVVIPFFVVWIWAIIDCFITKKMTRTEKVAWLIALVLLNVFAAVAYWVVRLASKKEAPAAGAGG